MVSDNDRKNKKQNGVEITESEAAGMAGESGAVDKLEEEGAVTEPLDLEAQLAEAQSQAAEYLDGWQRARAELANVKKRMERERAQLRDQAGESLALELLPVLDDFDLAVENLPEDLDGHEWVNGLLLIHRKLFGQLEGMGLAEIDALGQPFDPEYHEAIAQVPSDEYESGAVAVVLRKGYIMGNKVIRPSLVQVAQ
jgi:molecular chaperone GrpE